jgi:hypothetical protein
MKKISRLYGISLALCGLICFSSCDKDEGKSLVTPSDLTVISAADNYALLAWSTNIYVESYEISIGSASGASEGSYYNATALTPNTNYTWKIRAKRGTEVTAWVDGPAFTTMEAMSASAPTGLAASSVTNKSAVLTWTSNAPSFKIAIGGNTYTSSAASYVVENLSGATTYSWSVKAVNSPISGNWVAGPDFVTLEDVFPPTVLTASSITTTSAVLSWTSNATSFEIEVGGNTYPTTANSYTLTGLTPNTVYPWKVRAEKNTVISDWSSGSSFRTNPTIPPSATVNFGNQSWKPNYMAAQYDDPYLTIGLYSNDPNSWATWNDVVYPFCEFWVVGNTADNYSESNGYAPSYEYDIDYFHQTFIDFFGDGSLIFGDYWMDVDFPSSINITAIDASTVSGTVNLTLLDLDTWMESDYETIINVPLSITFANIPITGIAPGAAPVPGSASSSVQSNPVLKPGKYPIKFNKNKEEKLKLLKLKK